MYVAVAVAEAIGVTVAICPDLTPHICCQVLRAALELGQVRQEIDRRIAEKEEEFDNSR